MAAGLVILAGCGAPTAKLARHQTIRVHWREVGVIRGRDRLVFSVRRISLGPRGWSVDATVANDSPSTTFLVWRPHFPGKTEFGLIVSGSRRLPAEPSRVFATRAAPRIRRTLRPGRQWQGRFGGPDELAAGVYVRVVFGRLSVAGPYLWRGYWITNHVARVQ